MASPHLANVLNQIDEFKEKLTSAEYKSVLEELAKVKNNSSHDVLKATLQWGSNNRCSRCEYRQFNMEIHYTETEFGKTAELVCERCATSWCPDLSFSDNVLAYYSSPRGTPVYMDCECDRCVKRKRAHGDHPDPVWTICEHLNSVKGIVNIECEWFEASRICKIKHPCYKDEGTSIVYYLTRAEAVNFANELVMKLERRERILREGLGLESF